MGNKELCRYLGFKITLLRMKCYELGLKRMELEYWTEEQTQFLIDNYRSIGDKELAKIFQENWPKNKTWTIKHIEKKRLYLKLKRTEEELKAIQQRNVDNGCFLLCPVKRWAVTGVAAEGEIRMWRQHSGEKNNSRVVPMIKINGKFIHWNRWAWEQAYGPIPEGLNVIYKDDNPYNHVVENLELVTDDELSRRNSQKSSVGLSDNYVAGIMSLKNPSLRAELLRNPELLEVKRLQLKLNRLINEKSNREEAADNAK